MPLYALNLFPRVASRIGIRTVDFPSYTRPQLRALLKIMGVAISLDPLALDLCAKVVAAESGDIRYAKQLCQIASTHPITFSEMMTLITDYKQPIVRRSLRSYPLLIKLVLIIVMKYEETSDLWLEQLFRLLKIWIAHFKVLKCPTLYRLKGCVEQLNKEGLISIHSVPRYIISLPPSCFSDSHTHTHIELSSYPRQERIRLTIPRFEIETAFRTDPMFGGFL